MADFQIAFSYVVEIWIVDLNSFKITIKSTLGMKVLAVQAWQPELNTLNWWKKPAVVACIWNINSFDDETGGRDRRPAQKLAEPASLEYVAQH